MAASYGSLARFKDIRRIHQISDSTMVGASGDMADFQQVKRMLEGLMTDEAILEDGHELTTGQIYEYLSNVMYARRSKFDPYWNALLVAGLDKGEPCVLFFPPFSLSIALSPNSRPPTLRQLPRTRRPPRRNLHVALDRDGLRHAPRATPPPRRTRQARARRRKDPHGRRGARDPRERHARPVLPRREEFEQGARRGSSPVGGCSSRTGAGERFADVKNECPHVRSSKSRPSRPRASRLASPKRRRPSGALPRACEDVSPVAIRNLLCCLSCALHQDTDVGLCVAHLSHRRQLGRALLDGPRAEMGRVLLGLAVNHDLSLFRMQFASLSVRPCDKRG